MKPCNFVLYINLFCVCRTLYTVHLEIFVDDNERRQYEELTHSFISQLDQSIVTESFDFYNTSNSFVLDDTFIIKDNLYTTSTTRINVLFDIQNNVTNSLALYYISAWTNTTFISLSSNVEESLFPSLHILPTIDEYLEIALSLFKMKDNAFFEIIIITNTYFDWTVFSPDNDTMYSIRLYSWNNVSMDPSLHNCVTDGSTNGFLVIGTYSEVRDILLEVNTTISLQTDQWIVAPRDSFKCPDNINTFPFVCIVPSEPNITEHIDIDQYIYKQYLMAVWEAANLLVSDTCNTTHNLNKYLKMVTMKENDTTLQLNIIKYYKTDGIVREYLISNWTRQNGFYISENPFENATCDTLSVVLIHEPPFISKIDTSNGVIYEGYSIDVLNEIAERVGFKYTLYPVPDGEYGVLRPDGTWSGIIGEVARGAAVIGIGPISVTTERETVIDFSAPYYDFAGLQILMRDPTVYHDMFAFASAFSGLVWLIWFILQLGTAVILYVFHRLQLKTFSSKPQHNPFIFKECVWFVMGSITLAGVDRSPITISSRVLVAGFWFFCQIMMGTYTANLAAFMTSSRLSYSIESFEDLSTQTSITYSLMKGTAAETYFARMAKIESDFYSLWKEMSYESDDFGSYAVWEYPFGETYTKMWNSIQATGLVYNSEEGINKVISENFAYICETPFIKYEMNRQCGLLTIGRVFSPKPYAFVLQQNSPLLDSISNTILQMQSETIIQELKDKWWKNATAVCPSSEENQGLSVKAVGGIFIVMAVGCCVSFLVLLVEVLWTKHIKLSNQVEIIEHKTEIKENDGSEIPSKCDEDNLSLIDLNKY